MPRSERLHIPEVQRTSIRQARRQKEPFKVLASEQRVLGLWLGKRFQVYDEQFAEKGYDIRMSKVKREVGIAYVAIKHAFEGLHDTALPKLQERTLISYFQEISPGVHVHPHTGKPIDSPDRELLQNVVDLFNSRQPYLSDRIESRFDYSIKDKDYEDYSEEEKGMQGYLDSTVICAALGWHMLEVQLMLQNEGVGEA